MKDEKILHLQDAINRRMFIKTSGLGLAALAGLFGKEGYAATPQQGPKRSGGLKKFPNAKPKANRVIYLFQSGAPSHLDLFDYKPGLEKRFGEDLPDSIRKGQRLTGMTSGQAKFPVTGSMFKFAQHGKGRIWMSEILPHMATIADDICMINSMHTDAINHDPAVTFFQTGNQLAGRPSIG